MSTRCRSTNKICYDSREEALVSLRRIRKNPDAIKQSLGYLPKMVYRCKSCGRWHLTAKIALKIGRRRRRKGAQAYR